MEGGFIAELIAGVLYLVIGVPLVLRARRTQGVPERFLGPYCLLTGVSYVLYEIPFVLETGSLTLPLIFSGRLLFDAAVVVIALFTRRFFHGVEAAPLLGVTVLLVLSGLALSALSGDWDGYAPLRDAGFWLEWSGQLVPFAWLGIEGGVQWTRARRRVPLGLSDPMSAHRFLLWSLFALFQLCSNFALVIMYVEFEMLARFSPALDALVGALEVASIAAIGLACFAPSGYCRWLARSAQKAA